MFVFPWVKENYVYTDQKFGQLLFVKKCLWRFVFQPILSQMFNFFFLSIYTFFYCFLFASRDLIMLSHVNEFLGSVLVLMKLELYRILCKICACTGLLAGPIVFFLFLFLAFLRVVCKEEGEVIILKVMVSHLVVPFSFSCSCYLASPPVWH